MSLPIKDAIMILKESANAQEQGYYDHLSVGGKGDPSTEVGIEALRMGADALENRVEVVRCKDCEYWSDYDWRPLEMYPDDANHKYCELINISTHAGFYCGLAERKTDDTH